MKKPSENLKETLRKCQETQGTLLGKHSRNQRKTLRKPNRKCKETQGNPTRETLKKPSEHLKGNLKEMQ